MAIRFAPVGAFTTPCPSRLGFSFRCRPHSSPLCHLISYKQHLVSSMHLRASSFESLNETKEKWDAILGTDMFQKADRVIVEVIVQAMEKLPVQKDQHLLQQGEASDGSMFIVASGTFECIDDVTGNVEKVLSASDLFGEIAPKFGTKRALTVKAASSGATVWRIPYHDFIKSIKSKTDAFDASLVTAIEKNPEYASYFAMKERVDVFRKCSFFKSLQHRDFDQVVKSAELRLLAEGEVLFNQGDEGDTMYVVKEGSIDIVSDQSKKILKTCKKSDSFGELAIFFSSESKRQASAVATENCQLWEVKKDVLFSAAQESDLSEQALSAYHEAYKDKRVSFRVFWEYLKIKSRPKKKPVSFHSTFSIFSTGVAFAALMPLFKPGFGRYGFQIFDTVHNISDSNVHLLQMASWMMAATGVMGIARLPPNTPASRRVSFIFPTWAVLLSSAVLSSNFNFHPTAWWYDGFKFPGNLFLTGISIAGHFQLLKMMDNAIAGSNKGRDANSLATTRVSAFIHTLAFLFAWFLMNITVMPFVTGSSTAAALFKKSVSVLDQNGLNGLALFPPIFIVMQASLGSLINTLQFEKRIKPRIGAVLGSILVLLCDFDISLFLRRDMQLELPLSLSDIFKTFTKYSLMYWGVTIVGILNAFRRKITGTVETKAQK